MSSTKNHLTDEERYEKNLAETLKLKAERAHKHITDGLLYVANNPGNFVAYSNNGFHRFRLTKEFREEFKERKGLTWLPDDYGNGIERHDPILTSLIIEWWTQGKEPSGESSITLHTMKSDKYFIADYEDNPEEVIEPDDIQWINI